mmetsp:Transcript_6160/g.15160  ORF Transcript_6160/g.15160 Transcript_6160/m.15160 type:complete len:162 (+) Transcript_6160:3458-3943(+)
MTPGGHQRKKKINRWGTKACGCRNPVLFRKKEVHENKRKKQNRIFFFSFFLSFFHDSRDQSRNHTKIKKKRKDNEAQQKGMNRFGTKKEKVTIPTFPFFVRGSQLHKRSFFLPWNWVDFLVITRRRTKEERRKKGKRSNKAVSGLSIPVSSPIRFSADIVA